MSDLTEWQARMAASIPVLSAHLFASPLDVGATAREVTRIDRICDHRPR